MNNKTRHQAGAPASKGGEFKAQTRTESGVVLTSEMSARQLKFIDQIASAEEISTDFTDLASSYSMTRIVSIPAENPIIGLAHSLRTSISHTLADREWSSDQGLSQTVSTVQVWTPSNGWVDIDLVNTNGEEILGVAIPELEEISQNRRQGAHDITDAHLVKALAIIRQ